MAWASSVRRKMTLSTLSVTGVARTLSSNTCCYFAKICLSLLSIRRISFVQDRHLEAEKCTGCMKSWPSQTSPCNTCRNILASQSHIPDCLGFFKAQWDTDMEEKRLGTDCALMEYPSKRAEVETDSRGSPKTECLSQRVLISRPTRGLKWNNIWSFGREFWGCLNRFVRWRPNEKRTWESGTQMEQLRRCSAWVSSVYMN